MHLHLAVPGLTPAADGRDGWWDPDPTIRDDWHTELSAVAREGHAVPMHAWNQHREILVRTRRVS